MHPENENDPMLHTHSSKITERIQTFVQLNNTQMISNGFHLWPGSAASVVLPWWRAYIWSNAYCLWLTGWRRWTALGAEQQPTIGLRWLSLAFESRRWRPETGNSFKTPFFLICKRVRNNCTDRRWRCSGNCVFTEMFDWKLTWVGEKTSQQSTFCLAWISTTLEAGCFTGDGTQTKTTQEHNLTIHTFYKQRGPGVALISDDFVPPQVCTNLQQAEASAEKILRFLKNQKWPGSAPMSRLSTWTVLLSWSQREPY